MEHYTDRKCEYINLKTAHFIPMVLLIHQDSFQDDAAFVKLVSYTVLQMFLDFSPGKDKEENALFSILCIPHYGIR